MLKFRMHGMVAMLLRCLSDTTKKHSSSAKMNYVLLDNKGSDCYIQKLHSEITFRSDLDRRLGYDDVKIA
jgi:hypothetical protein